MTARRIALVGAVLGALLLCSSSAGQKRAPRRPDPPRTGPYSVQLFQGGSQYCLIALYPPKTYIDNSPIRPGTKVRMKVYRSHDGGKTYGTRGVSIVFGGEGHVGQGEDNARIKRWIDCKLKVLVDNKKPYVVRLAASAVVGGVASTATTRYLTFRYATDNGTPRLIRYETPSATGPGVADELARPLPQELPTRWEPGEFVVTKVWTTPQAKDEKCAKSLQSNINKPLRIALLVDQIDLVGAPGLHGNPVDPASVKQGRFPGNATLQLLPRDGSKPDPNRKPLAVRLRFLYDYRHRHISLEDSDRGMRMGAHFYQNATHYIMRGTWEITLRDKGGHDKVRSWGTWQVKKRKPQLGAGGRVTGK